MVDKLKKKRVKVDYSLIIFVLNLETDFIKYMSDHPSRRSLRRQQYTFLLKRKVDINKVYSDCIEHDLHTYDDWYREQCRIAKTPWLED